jgi:alkyl sulfatase BDS1-like metallo-beta-lactamase superfamily hydrolase
MTRKEKDYVVPRFVPPELKELLEKLTPATIQIGSNSIWCLYAPEKLFANSIIIEGTDGVIVVDTGASKQAGKYIKQKIAELTDKPVTTIIYTHHHYDHTQGAGEIVSKETADNKEVTIIAAKNFTQEEITENITTGLIMTWRSSYGYGLFLEPKEQKDFVIGGMMAKPCIGPGAHLKPNLFVEGKLELELHGRKLILLQTGGEAATELVVYLPQEKILLCADEIYPSNPNLHSLRGTKPRNVLDWITAIDNMRELEIEHLVGNHGKPVSGAEKIQEILLYYRDIIQYQHDQAVRLINNGYTAQELAEELAELPDYLHYPPYSLNYYGHIRHNVPEFFVGYISWFGGDPVDLQPTPKTEKA